METPFWGWVIRESGVLPFDKKSQERAVATAGTDYFSIAVYIGRLYRTSIPTHSI
jgi:hypothetical protein